MLVTKNIKDGIKRRRGRKNLSTEQNENETKLYPKLNNNQN